MASTPHRIGNKINELNSNKDFQIEELNSKVQQLKQENQYLKHKCDRESELVVELEREMQKIIEENQDLHVHAFKLVFLLWLYWVFSMYFLNALIVRGILKM